MSLNEELISELKLREIPVNLILAATCNSPPGIGQNTDSREDDHESFEGSREQDGAREACNTRDQLEPTADDGELQAAIENVSRVSNLGEYARICTSGADYSKGAREGPWAVGSSCSGREKSTTSADSRRRALPRLHLPVRRRAFQEERRVEGYGSADCDAWAGAEVPNGGRTSLPVVQGGGVSTSEKDLEFGHLPKYSSSLSRYLSSYHSERESGLFGPASSVGRDPSGESATSGADYGLEVAQFSSNGPELCGAGRSGPASDVIPLDEEQGGPGSGQSDRSPESGIQSDHQDKPGGESCWGAHLDKLIPVSKLLVNENHEIILNEVSNRERYSRIFRDGEDFSSIFEKCWKDAGEELRWRDGADGLQQTSTEGQGRDRPAPLDHVPFQSDLIMVNSKRKIGTTVPANAVGGDRVAPFRVGSSVIDPMGLLKYVQDQSRGGGLWGDGEPLKDKAYVGEQGSGYMGRGPDRLVEDMSTRASTLNNLQGIRSSGDGSVAADSAQSSLVSAGLGLGLANPGVYSGETHRSSLHSYLGETDRTAEHGGGGGGGGEEGKIVEITELDQDLSVGGRESHGGQRESEGPDNRSAFEDFLVIERRNETRRGDRPTVKLYKDPEQSVQRLRESLREADRTRLADFPGGLLSGENMHRSIYEEFNEVRSRQLEAKSIENVIDESKYDYGFHIEVGDAGRDTGVEMSPQEVPSQSEDSDSETSRVIEIPNSGMESAEVAKGDLSEGGEEEASPIDESDSVEGREYSSSTQTRYLNSLGLTRDFRQIFRSFSLQRVLSVSMGPHFASLDRKEGDQTGQSGPKNWRETAQGYESLRLLAERRNLVLTCVISTNMILISLANIIIPIVYSIRSALFPILTVNAAINFLIFYLINGTLMYSFTRKMSNFGKSVQNDHLLLLQRINQIKRERRRLELESGDENEAETEDILEHIYSQILYDYVQIMEDWSIEKMERHRRSVWAFFVVGILQISSSLFLDIFAIDHFKFDQVFVNMFNLANLLVSVVLNLAYLRRRGGRLCLKDAFNKNLLLKLDRMLQEDQLKFLTYSSSLVEQILLRNLANNQESESLSIHRRSVVSNISLLEMDQQKLQKLQSSKINNVNILCRIHLDVHKILKPGTPIGNCINELWPFLYVHYNKSQRRLVISSNNSALHKREDEAKGKARSCLMEIPAKFISIESIQSSTFPWIFVHKNHQYMERDHSVTRTWANDPQALSRPPTAADTADIVTHDEADLQSRARQYIQTVGSLLLPPESESLTLSSLLQSTETIDKQNKDLEHKLSHILHNYNFLSFFSSENSETADGPEDDPIYVINCTVPADYFLSLGVDLEYRDSISRDEMVRLQLACFSFEDLLTIYTLIS
ncbi:transmembrane domain-containing protein [Cryptosporidium canis]|uniref:Transmembrane domain-containing protein n=1 Tax=Cryptosporidium canis TaxID=195482 RepID=A0A9D5DFY1_9CRYT|nr:transmembrane domain-containing protein [Cryptosporidium canis]